VDISDTNHNKSLIGKKAGKLSVKGPDRKYFSCCNPKAKLMTLYRYLHNKKEKDFH
jgi:hypothetical protein